MRYGFRIVAALCLVALLVPVAAVAKDAKVQGPAGIVGAGYFGGELELVGEERQRPVRILGRAGYIGVLDLGGDLRIRCTGKGRVQRKETDAGTAYRCAGRRGGEIVLLGSHFAFRGFSTHYRALLPEGASGTWRGERFAVRQPGRGGGSRQAEPKPARERDEIPSLDELAAMLAALDG